MVTDVHFSEECNIRLPDGLTCVVLFHKGAPMCSFSGDEALAGTVLTAEATLPNVYNLEHGEEKTGKLIAFCESSCKTLTFKLLS